MTTGWRLAGPLVGLAMALCAHGALAQKTGDSPLGDTTSADGAPLTASQKLSRYFGPPGLLAEMSQDENYGNINTRIAQMRAQIEGAKSTGVYSGYTDEGYKLSVPINLLLNLPDNKSLIRFKGTGIWSWAEPERTYSRTRGFSGLAEYVYIPDETTVLGFGVTASNTGISILNSHGSARTYDLGFQANLIYRFNERWGVAATANYMWVNNRSEIPLGRLSLVTDQNSRRTFAEATVVGNYENQHASWVPEGWTLYPKLNVNYHRQDFETVYNSLGRKNDGTVGPLDDYLTAAAVVRLQKNGFRPLEMAPYVEVGYERELINDLNVVVDDRNILRSKVGFQMTLPNTARFDLSLSRNDGFKGDRSLTKVTLIYNQAF